METVAAGAFHKALIWNNQMEGKKRDDQGRDGAGKENKKAEIL